MGTVTPTSHHFGWKNLSCFIREDPRNRLNVPIKPYFLTENRGGGMVHAFMSGPNFPGRLAAAE